MRSERLVVCRGCEKLIRFVLTPKRRRMPIDPRPANGEGTIRLEQAEDGVVAVTLSGDELERARERRELLFTSHFATCPKAQRFKRRRPRKGEAGRST